MFEPLNGLTKDSTPETYFIAKFIMNDVAIDAAHTDNACTQKGGSDVTL